VDDRQKQPLQVSFNASLKVDTQGSRATFGQGLIPIRELDECSGFGELMQGLLTHSRAQTAGAEPLGRLSEGPALEPLGWMQTGAHFARPEGQKGNSGLKCSRHGSTRRKRIRRPFTITGTAGSRWMAR